MINVHPKTHTLILDQRVFQWSESLDNKCTEQTGCSIADLIKKTQEESGSISIKHWEMGETYICSGISMCSSVQPGVFVQARRALGVSNGIINLQRHWRKKNPKQLLTVS